MERYADVAPGVRLWIEDVGDVELPPMLLIMGANASGLTWPDELVTTLAQRHRVIRYDHRDTGRSTWDFDAHPYALTDLAADAVAVLDALDVPRAHVVGMSMGGTLVQLLLLDHPERLHSAVAFCTARLDTSIATDPGDGAGPELPDPDPRLMELWQQMTEPRTRADEIAWRIEHWRLLNGTAVAYDAEEFRRLEERVVDHAGRHDNPAAHARASQTGLDRGAELAGVTTPTLIVDAPHDPVNPYPHAQRLAAAIPTARLATVPGMGHAISHAVIPELADTILTHTAGAEQ